MAQLPSIFLLLAIIPVSGAARAQDAARVKLPDLSGTWQAQTPDGPQTVIVRPDSSASFGDEIVRWRMVPDTVYLALGGEWTGYHYALHGSKLVLSGGDLEDPVELRRVGPPSPRPDGVDVPPPPPWRAGQ